MTPIEITPELLAELEAASKEYPEITYAGILDRRSANFDSACDCECQPFYDHEGEDASLICGYCADIIREFEAKVTPAVVLALVDEIERLNEELRCEHHDNAAVCYDLRTVIEEYQQAAQRADAANHEHYGRMQDQIAIRDQMIARFETELQEFKAKEVQE